MAVALRDVADIALLQLLDAVAPVRAEQGDTELAVDDVLPLVGIRMPVQRPQRAGIEIEHDAGDGFGDREAAGIDAPLAAALIGRVRRLRQQAVFVGFRRQLPALQRYRWLCG